MAKLEAPIILDNFLSSSSVRLIERVAREHKKMATFGVMKAPFDQPVIMPRMKSNRVYHLAPDIQGEWVDEIRQQIQQIFDEKALMQNVPWELGVPQLSYYREGDFYAPHRDSTEYGLTFVYLLGEKKFQGGALSFQLEGKKHTVRFKSNRAIIFPSHLLHEVTKVKGEGLRISLQFFLTSFAGFQVFKSELTERRIEIEAYFKTLAGGATSIEDFVIAKKAVMNFKVSSFEGSFRFLYYKLFGSLPKNVEFGLSLQPDFSFFLNSGKKLKIEIKVVNEEVLSVYSIGKRDVLIFPFRLTMWEISQTILARYSSSKPPKTR